MTTIRFAIFPLALGLAACTVGPDYQPPKEQLATRFAEGTTNPIAVAGAQYWWRALNDPTLNELVQTGVLSEETGLRRAGRSASYFG